MLALKGCTSYSKNEGRKCRINLLGNSSTLDVELANELRTKLSSWRETMRRNNGQHGKQPSKTNLYFKAKWLQHRQWVDYENNHNVSLERKYRHMRLFEHTRWSLVTQDLLAGSGMGYSDDRRRRGSRSNTGKRGRRGGLRNTHCSTASTSAGAVPRAWGGETNWIVSEHQRSREEGGRGKKGRKESLYMCRHIEGKTWGERQRVGIRS
ncbi:hypothetical protein B0H19DRAFT_1298941 [Mycena capillaripes]|nr:hypothetical protein B0H19DRAFT_1298941 [Mycena capillaripes]